MEKVESKERNGIKTRTDEKGFGFFSFMQRAPRLFRGLCLNPSLPPVGLSPLPSVPPLSLSPRSPLLSLTPTYSFINYISHSYLLSSLSNFQLLFPSKWHFRIYLPKWVLIWSYVLQIYRFSGYKRTELNRTELFSN